MDGFHLLDLDAEFITEAGEGHHRHSGQQTPDGMQGIMFQCPKCAVGKVFGYEDGRGHYKGAHYIRIYFSNPRGAIVAPPEADDNPRWQMSGTSLEDLTLSPSVDLSRDKNGQPVTSGCLWHGFVTNGIAK